MRLWVAVVLLLAVVDNCHSSDCDTPPITLTTASGSIKYPPYGGTYENSKKVCWIINSGHPIYITFTKFDYEFDKDFLYVRDGGGKETDPLIGEFTGSNLPGPLHPTLNVAFLQSVTDYAYRLDGFELQWHYTDEKGGCVFGEKYYENDTPLDDVCTKFVCKDNEWKFIGNDIDPNCAESYIANDPHFVTFDGHYYDWHGQCKYTITQEGPVENKDPGYYMYGQFKRCLPGSTASCLDEITFKNDKGSVIALKSELKSLQDDNFIVKFNGKVVNLPDKPQRYDFDGKTFFAWIGDFTDQKIRKEDTCVCIVGSQGLMIQFCGWDIRIWAPNKLTESLFGLSGPYLKMRDGNSATSIKEFAQSWKIPLGSACNDNRRMARTTCDADTSINRYREDCANNLSDLDMGDKDRNITIENCAFDRCIIINSGSTNPSPDDWLRNSRKSAERTVVIRSIEKDLTVTKTPTSTSAPPTTTPPVTTTVLPPTTTPTTTTTTATTTDLAKKNVIVQILQRVGP